MQLDEARARGQEFMKRVEGGEQVRAAANGKPHRAVCGRCQALTQAQTEVRLAGQRQCVAQNLNLLGWRKQAVIIQELLSANAGAVQQFR